MKTEFTSDLYCPYCGYMYNDADKLFNKNGFDKSIEVQCENCYETYIAEAYQSITYFSYKKGGSYGSKNGNGSLSKRKR